MKRRANEPQSNNNKRNFIDGAEIEEFNDRIVVPSSWGGDQAAVAFSTGGDTLAGLRFRGLTTSKATQ